MTQPKQIRCYSTLSVLIWMTRPEKIKGFIFGQRFPFLYTIFPTYICSSFRTMMQFKCKGLGLGPVIYGRWFLITYVLTYEVGDDLPQSFLHWLRHSSPFIFLNSMACGEFYVGKALVLKYFYCPNVRL